MLNLALAAAAAAKRTRGPRQLNFALPLRGFAPFALLIVFAVNRLGRLGTNYAALACADFGSNATARARDGPPTRTSSALWAWDRMGNCSHTKRCARSTGYRGLPVTALVVGVFAWVCIVSNRQACRAKIQFGAANCARICSTSPGVCCWRGDAQWRPFIFRLLINLRIGARESCRCKSPGNAIVLQFWVDKPISLISIYRDHRHDAAYPCRGCCVDGLVHVGRCVGRRCRRRHQLSGGKRNRSSHGTRMRARPTVAGTITTPQVPLLLPPDRGGTITVTQPPREFAHHGSRSPRSLRGDGTLILKPATPQKHRDRRRIGRNAPVLVIGR